MHVFSCLLATRSPIEEAYQSLWVIILENAPEEYAVGWIGSRSALEIFEWRPAVILLKLFVCCAQSFGQPFEDGRGRVSSAKLDIRKERRGRPNSLSKLS